MVFSDVYENFPSVGGGSWPSSVASVQSFSTVLFTCIGYKCSFVNTSLRSSKCSEQFVFVLFLFISDLLLFSKGAHPGLLSSRTVNLHVSPVTVVYAHWFDSQYAVDDDTITVYIPDNHLPDNTTHFA